MARRKPSVSLRRASELERVEALCDALIERMGSDPAFTPRTRVGRARAAEITTLLEQVGWTLRETVDRKLPLLRLPTDLQRLLRAARLEPSKALLLGRVKQVSERTVLTERVLHGMTQRELYDTLYRSSPSEKALESDLAWLSLEATRVLGMRVIIDQERIVIDCQSLEGITTALERLGIYT
jgi:hypothetical protein